MPQALLIKGRLYSLLIKHNAMEGDWYIWYLGQKKKGFKWHKIWNNKVTFLSLNTIFWYAVSYWWLSEKFKDQWSRTLKFFPWKMVKGAIGSRNGSEPWARRWVPSFPGSCDTKLFGTLDISVKKYYKYLKRWRNACLPNYFFKKSTNVSVPKIEYALKKQKQKTNPSSTWS